MAGRRATWTCIAAAGASCTAGPVAGDLNDTPDLPVGGTATYTLIANLDPTASSNLVNTATVAAPAGATDPNPADNSAIDAGAVYISRLALGRVARAGPHRPRGSSDGLGRGPRRHDGV